MHHFLKGLLIGFSIAAPVGPIGLLCLRRALVDGRLVGFISGLGAATADTLYGAVAALGLSAVSGLITRHYTALGLIGGFFLVLLGLRTSFAPAPPPEPQPRSAVHVRGLAAAYVSILGLTLANPMTIVAFAGTFAALGLGWQAGGDWAAGWLILGVFVSSCSWWLFLSCFAGWFGDRLTPRTLHRINLVAGLLIAGFGVWLAVRVWLGVR